MQITKAEVVPIELKLAHPVQICCLPEIHSVTAVFVRLETRNGLNAWGCGVAHPDLTGEEPADVLRACRECAAIAPDLHPTLIEQSLARVREIVGESTGALCAFDLALHDLLGLAASLPLYRLLGGYRNQIQTSATVPVSPVAESVACAEERARLGFRMLKIKGTPMKCAPVPPSAGRCLARCAWTPTAVTRYARRWKWRGLCATSWRCWSSLRRQTTWMDCAR
jgi:L-alanine-DL-glutamate epimerase-like enolase superfamily enzyme